MSIQLVRMIMQMLMLECRFVTVAVHAGLYHERDQRSEFRTAYTIAVGGPLTTRYGVNVYAVGIVLVGDILQIWA